MRATPALSPDGRTMVVSIPLTFRRRRGRKVIIVPDGAQEQPRPPAPMADPIVIALARAHRWKKMLETGEYASLRELAKAENVGLSYLCRVLRLMLLAPDIVDAMLDGRVPKVTRLAELMRPFPAAWAHQKISNHRHKSRHLHPG